ncbi:hypothetical protein A3D84_03305 [Candidatus Woesebacteria bacterium RIFCSPHIGHO2_02_FULL_42_20]|uniref:Uncharacterized protein n=1 Tax=Candidatus Woesebacteria bacterium RIFCSPHIGHO2_12_FULL_41_24 TaxID=1802510 RepID=A0A1F8ARW2_9BACT|nr:MAG: hypothetical protein A2W15_03495 [Candidatus Woesebacteria bacterium RBG_16_41_13]OGM34868.1 MAG: hypothetical protein A3D84_03305 [Candidatus Woesebacteria bacterium RIFCSPHIGHO2_02_FULL_42_20]OGM54497.1 MAG: hypothetical protein A3E44_00340 [Candidatus Woesebacteria bacterium RIFCSPHIGHO2_12_FULL_41_24]OGM65741.1 MAG: hypothetical protein A2969_00740 [Candidatus Woesebacteria bacterium RIFCSPLOWO2_01_FULL_42_67]OGM71805.1 MAG: hypothetical protein A3I55_00665 [Candidatus Woesebacteria
MKFKNKLKKSNDQDRKVIILLLRGSRPAASAAPQSRQNSISKNTKMALTKLLFTIVVPKS